MLDNECDVYPINIIDDCQTVLLTLKYTAKDIVLFSVFGKVSKQAKHILSRFPKV